MKPHVAPKPPVVAYAHDFRCPVCRAAEGASCTPRGHEGEELPHASRVMLAANRNSVEGRAWSERVERRSARSWRALPAPRTMEEVLDRMLHVLSFQMWPCEEVSALGVWTVPSKLFLPGDPVFLHWNNGGGERCGIIAWSSKKKAVIGPKYHRHTSSWWNKSEKKFKDRSHVRILLDFTDEARAMEDAAGDWMTRPHRGDEGYEGYPKQFLGTREGSGVAMRHPILPAFRVRVQRAYADVAGGREHAASR